MYSAETEGKRAVACIKKRLANVVVFRAVRCPAQLFLARGCMAFLTRF